MFFNRIGGERPFAAGARRIRLVNKIITVYGKPDQIVVELARDLKLSDEKKKEVQRDIKKNTDAAIARGKKLEEIGVPNTGANRMVLRLWEALGVDVMTRNCPYSGKRISAGMLFDGSCDVDHILPRSRTLDDSFANRTLCRKEFNRLKTNKTPWEAWGDTPQWETIAANLKNLPPNKAWRFAPDAIERFEGENDFSARSLKDTQYLSRIARAYLDALYDGSDDKSHVWVVPGRLTEMLRRHWGLNSLLPDHNRGTVKAKNRTDHRHHAIDAAVVAATDRSLIQRISNMAQRDEIDGAEQVARSVPPPWEDFRDDIATQLQRMIVSHRADHGRIDPAARKSGKDSTSGALHEATALSIIDNERVAVRIPLTSLSPAQLEEGGRSGWIRDAQLRHALAVATKKDGKDFKAAVEAFACKPGPYRGIKRVRIVKPLQHSARVYVPANSPTKAYQGGSNHRYEVWRLPEGKVVHHVVPMFDAHQSNLSRPHPAAKRIHRFLKGDLVRLETSKFGPVIATVEKPMPRTAIARPKRTSQREMGRLRDPGVGSRIEFAIQSKRYDGSP